MASNNSNESACTICRRTGDTIKHFGISAALLTPFQSNGSIDTPLLCAHANQLLAQGVQGVTLFGTTGEGASIGEQERSATIAAAITSGIESARMTVGLCGNAIDDIVRQIRQSVDLGITDFLLLPPFYFKDVAEDALRDWHMRLFDEADPRAMFILYHIPQITHVPLSHDLVMRLRHDAPDKVIAIKDSSGVWDNTRALIDSGDIPVLVGDERLLHKAAALGAAGSICGMANLCPDRVRAVFDTHKEDKKLSSEVDLIVSEPVIPALKLAMAQISSNAAWEYIRPPLQALTGTARTKILAAYPGEVFA